MSRPDALSFAEAHTQTKAWYDMAVGQRAYRLAYIIDAAQCCGLDEGELEALHASLAFHQELLARDSFFRAHTNHGLYQDLGQLAASRRFLHLDRNKEYFELASLRLQLMFERSFFPSGIHREHSPDYHYMILGTLLGARASGLLKPSMNKMISEAEDVLRWLAGPYGTLATIGDTALKSRIPISRGGEPEGIRAFDDAGMVFIKEPRRHFAQIAGFHSRTHKHADHFSMVWWDGNREILIDPGRYGYVGQTVPRSDLWNEGFWYSDPNRVYVERTRAHNCVEIDGRDYPRKNTRPFGSALTAAEKQGDLYVTTCEATHFRTVRHRRDCILKPGHFLLMLDWLYDRSGEEHAFRQWLQVAPDWSALPAESGARFAQDGETLAVLDLLERGVPVVLWGQTEPFMSGWRSDGPESITPSNSLYFERKGSLAGS